MVTWQKSRVEVKARVSVVETADWISAAMMEAMQIDTGERQGGVYACMGAGVFLQRRDQQQQAALYLRHAYQPARLSGAPESRQSGEGEKAYGEWRRSLTTALAVTSSFPAQWWGSLTLLQIEHGETQPTPETLPLLRQPQPSATLLHPAATTTTSTTTTRPRPAISRSPPTMPTIAPDQLVQLQQQAEGIRNVSACSTP